MMCRWGFEGEEEEMDIREVSIRLIKIVWKYIGGLPEVLEACLMQILVRQIYSRQFPQNLLMEE